MTPEQAQAHYEGIQENIRQNYLFAAATGSDKYLIENKRSKTYKNKIKINNLPEGATIEPYLESDGTKGEAVIIVEWTEISQSTLDEALKDTMRQFRKMVAEAADCYTWEIDCYVMQLFMAGKIDWDTAVETFKGNCEL